MKLSIKGIVDYCNTAEQANAFIVNSIKEINTNYETISQWLNAAVEGEGEGSLKNPVVVTHSEYKNYKHVVMACHMRLNTPWNEKFKDVLNRIRVCEQTQEDLDYLNQRVMSEEDYIMQNESFLRIVSTNKDVQKYNQIALDAIDGKFICFGCDKLTSLEGAPKEVGGNFSCWNCCVKFTVDDVKKVSNVKG